MSGMLDEIFIVINTVFNDKGIKKAKKETEDIGKSGKKVTPQLDKVFRVFNKIGQTGGKMGQTISLASKAMGGMAGAALGVVGAVVAVGVAYHKTMQQVERATDAMARANQQYINFSRQTGIGMGAMNKYAAAGMGLDYDFDPATAMSGIQNLQSNLANLRLTGQGAKPFQMLGINPMGKNATAVLEDIRGAIQRLDDATASNFLQQMGLSPEMLPILRMSRREFEAMSREWASFQLNEDQRQQLYEYSMELKRMNMQIKYLKDIFMLKLMPSMLKWKKVIADITLHFSHWVELVSRWNKVFGNIFDMLNPMRVIFETIKNIIYEIDDFIVWLLGGKSVIGENIGELADIAANIMKIISDNTPAWIKDFVNAVNRLVGLNGNGKVDKEKTEGFKDLVSMLMPGSAVLNPLRAMNALNHFAKSYANNHVEQNNTYYINGDGAGVGEDVSNSALNLLNMRLQNGASY